MHAPAAQIETRRTDWVAFGHYGLTHYRIWTQFDGRNWWQRHEWKREDGSTDLQDWIHGLSRHVTGDLAAERTA